jgi:hypothetical protein
MEQQLALLKPLTLLEPQCSELAWDEGHLEHIAVILHPLAMRIPNSEGVYFLSELQPKKRISLKTFLSRYANCPQKIRVSFDTPASLDQLLHNSEIVTAYGFGAEGWYLASLEE